MKNIEKLNSIIGKLLDQVDESVSKEKAPNNAMLEALKLLVSLTSSAYQIDGYRTRD